MTDTGAALSVTHRTTPHHEVPTGVPATGRGPAVAIGSTLLGVVAVLLVSLLAVVPFAT
jgi:hypothetical protein